MAARYLCIFAKQCAGTTVHVVFAYEVKYFVKTKQKKPILFRLFGEKNLLAKVVKQR